MPTGTRFLPIISEGDSSLDPPSENSCLSIDLPSGSHGEGARASYSGNVAIVTLGCAKNTVDSEVMLGVLMQQGFVPVADLEQADLIVVNTCGFLQSAVEESIDRILEASEYKKGGRLRQLIVAGCLVERYREDLHKSLPEVDRFLSTDEILRIGEGGDTSEDCFSKARRPYFLYDETMPRVLSTGGYNAYVKVAEGCDRPCAFCIIPKLRGGFRSRPLSGVIGEARNLLTQGVRELNLVAQDLTSYGTDFPGGSKSAIAGEDLGANKQKSQLASLLRELDKLGQEEVFSKHDFWIRLLYAYPIGVTEELLRTIQDSRHIARYLDLPLQHISHNVLKSMRRPLGEKGTRKLIEQIRTIAPEIALRTTFITGFPGEKEEDVEILRSFISEGHFAHVGVFCYSQEEEADSFGFPNQVDEEDKQNRSQLLIDAQRNVVSERLSAMIGSEIEVLFEGSHKETDLLFRGRAEWQAPDTDGEVVINYCEDESLRSNISSLVGRFVRVHITENTDYDLVGSLVGV